MLKLNNDNNHNKQNKLIIKKSCLQGNFQCIN